MKKISILFVALLGVFLIAFNTKKAYATVIDDDYRNLNVIDFSQVYYEGGKCKSDQRFDVKAGDTMTFVASTGFFGSAYNASTNSLSTGKKLGMSFVVEGGPSGDYRISLSYAYSGIFIGSKTFNYNGHFYIDDFMTRVDSLADFDRSHVMLYYGDKTLFKGFVADMKDLPEGFEYVSDSQITIHTSCSNPITTESIKESLVAYDYTDGIISSSQIETITDNYSTSSSVVGTHLLEFRAVDSSSNTRNLKVYVVVEDNEGPTISLRQDLTYEIQGRTITLDDIRSYFEVRDNYDGYISNSNLYDLTWDASGEFDGCTCKTYLITVKCDDSSGNVGTLTCNFQTIDTTPPQAKLKTMIVKLSEYYNGFLNKPVSEYFEYISDNSREIPYIYFENNYDSEEIKDVGDIPVRVTIIDKYGNKTIIDGVFQVIDDIAPMFYVKGDLITTTNTDTLTPNQIKTKIKANLKAKGINYDQVIMVDSNYFDTPDKEGKYEVKYAYKANNDIVYEYSEIEVIKVGKTESEATLDTDKDKQPYEPIGSKDKTTTQVETANVETKTTNNKFGTIILYVVVLAPILIGSIVFIVYKRRQRYVE